MDELRSLKDRAAQAMGRGQWKQAYKLYEELAAREQQEGTWPLRAGDAARKLGEHRQAIGWYERAAAAYGERGFVVRAIAVGKMIQSLDPGNDRVLRALDAAQKPTPPPRIPTPPPRAPQPLPPPPPTPAARRSGPPLSGRLSGPTLSPPPEVDLSMHSMEIVFDDVDDGIPIQASDIIPIDDLVDVVELEATATEVDEEELLARLPSFPLFQLLPRGAFLAVASQLDLKTLAPGEVVVRQGETGTTLYAIIDGEALVYLDGQRDQPLATLTAGDCFGEMALALDQPRAANVEAVTALELFEMDREHFASVLTEHPELGDVLSRMIKRRLVKNTMATAPLFQQLDGAARKELLLRFEIREVAAGTKLVAQGTPSDGLYVVLAGKVDVLSDGRVAATIGPGQTFGVAALIDTSHKSPTGFAAPVDAIVLRLPRAAFNEVISCYPPILAHLSEVAEAQQAWGENDAVAVV